MVKKPVVAGGGENGENTIYKVGLSIALVFDDDADEDLGDV
jgi:hypothetical protein